jgi:type IV pilus assembly protein PilE
LRSAVPSCGIPRLLSKGFTLIELCVALAVVAILSAIAYPSFHKVVLKSRRSDAHVALMQLAQSQARWRASHTVYATLKELNVADVSPQGHYQLAVKNISTTDFELVATAMPIQSPDEPCQVLKIKNTAGQVTHESGASEAVQNPPKLNQSCWPS